MALREYTDDEISVLELSEKGEALTDDQINILENVHKKEKDFQIDTQIAKENVQSQNRQILANQQYQQQKQMLSQMPEKERQKIGVNPQMEIDIQSDDKIQKEIEKKLVDETANNKLRNMGLPVEEDIKRAEEVKKEIVKSEENILTPSWNNYKTLIKETAKTIIAPQFQAKKLLDKTNEFLSEVSPEDEKRYEILAKNFGMGALGTVTGIGGMMKAVGLKESGKAITDLTEKIEKKYIDLKTKPDFIDLVARGFGSATTFLIPGIGVSKATQAMAFAPKLATILGTSASAVLESMVEGGSTYEESMARGKEHEQSQKNAMKTFFLNLPLNYILDKWIFKELPAGKKLTTAIMGAPKEAGQEYMQEMIGLFAQGDPILTAEAQKQGGLSATIGGIVGGGIGTGKLALDTLKIQIQEEPTKEEQLKDFKGDEKILEVKDFDKDVEQEPLKPETELKEAVPSVLEEVKIENIFNPKNPPISDVPITAIELDNGTILFDKKAKVHIDVLENLNINPENVKDGGFIINGKYITKSADMPRIAEQAKAKKRIKEKRKLEQEKSVLGVPEEQLSPQVQKIKNQLDKIENKIEEYTSQDKPIPDSLIKNRDNLLKNLGLEGGEMGRTVSPKRLLGEKIIKEEKQLITPSLELKKQLRKEEAISKKAYKLGQKEMRADLTDKFRTKQEDIKSLKTDVIDYAKENLPISNRGKFINMINNVKTQKNLLKAKLKIDNELDMLTKKQLIKDIKKKMIGINKSQKIAIEYKPLVKKLIDRFILTKPSETKLERLNATREFLKSNPNLPEKVIKSLDILNKKYVGDLSVQELEVINDKIDLLTKLGETKLRARQNLKDIEKSKIKNEILQDESIKKLQDIEEELPAVGKKLPIDKKLKNIYTKKLNQAHSLDLAISPVDVVVDVMDGNKSYQGTIYKNFKARTDLNFKSFLENFFIFKEEIWDLAKKLNLNEKNFERIGVYAADQQENGRGKLLASKITQEEIENIKLNQSEKILYDTMRNRLDELRPQIEYMMKNVYNKPLGNVKNYFSFMTDFKSMDEAELYQRIGDNAEEFGHPKKNPNLSFSKERVKDRSQKIKINAMEVYLNHIENALYAINMGEDNKMLFEIANDPDLKEKIGAKGQRILLQWLDLISRKGGSEGSKQIKFLDTLRTNIGAATLGFKLSSILIQPTALFDGASLIGTYAFKGMRDIATNKEYRQFVMDNMPEIKERLGDDPAYVEFSDNKTMAEIQKKGFWALQKFDQITATSVAWGAYLKYLNENDIQLDLDNPYKEGIDYAQSVVRRTQSSPLFKDLPFVITRGGLTGNKSLDRLIFQFQSFMLNRWSLIRHDLYNLGIKEGDYKKAGNIAFYLMMANFAELGIRKISKELINLLTGSDDDKEIKDGITKEFIMTLLGNIPFVSQAVSALGYGSIPVPSLSLIDTGLDKIRARLIKGKKFKTKLKGIANLLEVLLSTTSQLPGISQATDIIENLIDLIYKDTSKKKSGKPKTNKPKTNK
ncbi:MAG: hypothetical protein ABIJ17_01885 [Patescibacteria group bacterium]